MDVQILHLRDYNASTTFIYNVAVDGGGVLVESRSVIYFR